MKPTSPGSPVGPSGPPVPGLPVAPRTPGAPTSPALPVAPGEPGGPVSPAWPGRPVAPGAPTDHNTVRCIDYVNSVLYIYNVLLQRDEVGKCSDLFSVGLSLAYRFVLDVRSKFYFQATWCTLR